MDDNNLLGRDYPLTNVDEASSTKEKILLQSTLLFAKQGYVSVSMRDLATGTGLVAQRVAGCCKSYLATEAGPAGRRRNIWLFCGSRAGT